jgi:nucleoside phosphorylase
MTTYSEPLHCDDFGIAILCALRNEGDAVLGMFDEFWEVDALLMKAKGDCNSYTTGRIGVHNVVLAIMPGIGKGASASMAASLRSTFSSIRLGLVVGICGGVPPMEEGERKEMLLGDVVISTAVIQFDFGRQYPNSFKPKDTLESNLGRPNPEIRSFLETIQSIYGKKKLQTNSLTSLTALFNKEDFSEWAYPGADEDILYPPTYLHKHQQPGVCTICETCPSGEDDVCDEVPNSDCAKLMCNTKMQITRKRLEIIKRESQEKPPTAQMPEIHFGQIASGDTVMKSGRHRDECAKKANAVAFEMEGAGVWDNFPTVVIKGVCDYADSHKNKKWQKYAAASAAACMKGYLGQWRGTAGSQQRVGAPG